MAKGYERVRREQELDGALAFLLQKEGLPAILASLRRLQQRHGDPATAMTAADGASGPDSDSGTP